MDLRLCIFYVPGLDRRSIHPGDAPHVHRLLAEHPSLTIQTQPTTELFPTLVTGVGPDQHEIWNVSLRPDADEQPRRWYDRLPDALTTTVQCLRHLLDPGFELPAVPPRRRRRFDLHRLKFDFRIGRPDLVRSIGGVPSIFGLLPDESRYLVIKRFGDLGRWLDQLPHPTRRLDMIEFHAYDLASHWNLDRPAVMAGYLHELDAFIGELQHRCEHEGVTFILLVDHGQERVVGSINLRRLLRNAGLPEDEYDLFLSVNVARFWCHTDHARRTLETLLADAGHIHVLDSDELAQWGVRLDPDRFGDLYGITQQGWTFFPHDFHQPLGNLFVGLKNPLMRSRIFNPRHRGYHGHLPNHPAELGWMCIADARWTLTRDSMNLLDFAPTVLTLLGEPAAPYMTGRGAVAPVAARAAATLAS